MRETDIKKQLGLLKNLEPDKGFVQSSRMKILYGSEPTPSRMFVISQSLSSTLSMGLVVMFVVFIALGGVATLIRGPVFPSFQGADEQSLHAEAGTITQTIDVRLGEVNYLEDVEQNKLAQATAKKEATLIDEGQATSTDEEIDQLLNEAKEY